MRRWPLPLQPRFIVYTIVLLITAILPFEYIFAFASFYVGIPLLLFGILAVIGNHRPDPDPARGAAQLSAHGTHPSVFSRQARAIVYQRAKRALDKRPFGTQNDVYSNGYEWLHHSIAPKSVVREPFRFGESDCSKPYSASVFNISAMSFGALSPNAIRALNIGAKRGNFAHDTGEGGYSSYHRENGGDITCRNADGTFCPGKFEEAALCDQVKMIELKLSQGAKPSHGGVLPGEPGHLCQIKF